MILIDLLNQRICLCQFRIILQFHHCQFLLLFYLHLPHKLFQLLPMIFTQDVEHFAQFHFMLRDQSVLFFLLLAELFLDQIEFIIFLCLRLGQLFRVPLVYEGSFVGHFEFEFRPDFFQLFDVVFFEIALDLFNL